ncbi:MAG TPA: hypothetical protein VME70_07965 [Mycobacteriales bacterium]|nr:hypothetical protein [Mycobacteriales bacterium]
MATPPLLVDSDVSWLVEQACRAPSIHNTQPWRFVWDGTGFNLFADTSRGLTVGDPNGRELVISCGAALFNLRVALRQRGLVGSELLLPDPGQPRWLARVVVARGEPASKAERQRLAALVRRHTHRGGFDDRTLPTQLQVELHRVAEAEQACLVYLCDPGRRHKVLQLTREAAGAIDANERALAALADWTPAPGSGRRDGVPPEAYPARPRAQATEFAARDFDLGRGLGTAEEAGSSPGLLAVLVTDGDDERSWLRAGSALEHVLVDSARHWVFAALHSQVCEIPAARAELRRELGTAGYPQVLLRLGYAHVAATTPRRPVRDVLRVIEH